MLRLFNGTTSPTVRYRVKGVGTAKSPSVSVVRQGDTSGNLHMATMLQTIGGYHWRIFEDRIRDERFLALVDRGLLEPVIIESDEWPVGNTLLSLTRNTSAFCSLFALSLIRAVR